MKYIFIVLLGSFWSLLSFAQTDNLKGCQESTSVYADSIASLFLKNDLKPFPSYDSIIHAWKSQCGTSEPILRIEILESILDRREADSLIRLYYENDYQFIFENRLRDSRKLNYGALFEINNPYYSYLPLRSEFDSVSRELALALLREREDLSSDEKLNCLLFSGDLDSYFSSLGKQENYDSQSSQTLRNNRMGYLTKSAHIKVVTGLWVPVGAKNETFNASPKIGVHIGSILNRKLSFDLGANVRIMLNDNDYLYLVDSDTMSANSATSLFVGFNFYYTLSNYGGLKILPSLGFGLESVGTGIMKDEVSNDNEDNFHRVSTLHLKTGINLSYDVFKNDSIILGLYYHYSPYRWDTNLVTEFSEHAFSCELHYKF